MEEAYGRPGYAEARIDAERRARSLSSGCEITLQDIRSEIEPDMRAMVDSEVQIEAELSVPDPDALRMMDEASQESEVVLISDMYLPANAVKSILDRCGISGYSRLYVSSEYGATKHTGELFRIVSEESGVPFRSMRHIGDNRRSDYRIPKSLGIDARCRPSRMSRYLGAHPDQARFYARNRSLDRSVIVAMDMLLEIGAIDIPASDNWSALGARFGGPLAYAFSEHLYRSLRPGALRLYVSRDGYTPLAASHVFEKGDDCRYIHAQRILSYVLTDDAMPFGSVDVPSRASNRFEHDRLISRMRYILRFLKEDLGLESIPEDDGDLVHLYSSRISEIDAIRAEKRRSYRDYVCGICGDRDVDIIDSTTMKFTSQRLVEEMLGRSVFGHYLVALDDRDDLAYESFGRRMAPVAGWVGVNLPEFFLCSPEPPLEGWADGPLLDANPPEWEKERMAVYPDVSAGEMKYIEAMESVFGVLRPRMSYAAVTDWALLAASNPQCRALLSDMMWASSPDHSDWHHLLPRPSDVPFMIKKMVCDLIVRMNVRHRFFLSNPESGARCGAIRTPSHRCRRRIPSFWSASRDRRTTTPFPSGGDCADSPEGVS